jgi:hypothetical protein
VWDMNEDPLPGPAPLDSCLASVGIQRACRQFREGRSPHSGRSATGSGRQQSEQVAFEFLCLHTPPPVLHIAVHVLYILFLLGK